MDAAFNQIITALLPLPAQPGTEQVSGPPAGCSQDGSLEGSKCAGIGSDVAIDDLH